jgi:hypothetical protein
MHRSVVMALAELIDQDVDRFQDGIERVAVARQDHPGGQCAGAARAEHVEVRSTISRASVSPRRACSTACAMPRVT